MNLKTVVPLSAAVVLGLVAAIVARQLVGQGPAPTVDGVATNVSLTDIVVAAHDIAPGSTLGEGDLTVARVESKYAPANAAATPSALFHRVAKLQIPKGQIVHESFLAEAGVSGGLPGVIRPGFRAMTIEVNEFTGVAGLLQPGNKIDVLARIPDGEAGPATRTVVQNIEIIAVGTELTNKSAAASGEQVGSVIAPDQQPQNKAFARAITVLVTPADAEKLDLATANQARLILRASLDTDKSNVAGATLASLRGDAPTSPFPVNEPKQANHQTQDDVFSSSQKPTFKPTPTSTTHTITIVRGGVVSEAQVEKTSTSSAKDPQAGGSDMFAPLAE